MKFIFQKLKYYFDTALERNFFNLIYLLIFVSGFIIFSFSLIVLVAYKFGASVQLGESYPEFLWRVFVLFLNPGVLAGSEGSNIIDFFFKFTITILGIIIFSTLVGIVTQGFAIHLERLRSGQSIVLESNHIVICGYTKKTIPLIKQLSLAYENKSLVILIISIFEPKIIQERVKDIFPERIKIISRQGYIWQENMISRCNIKNCSGIFLLNPDNDDYYKTERDSDIEVTKSFISLVQSNDWQINPVKLVLEVFEKETAKNFISSQKDILQKLISNPKYKPPLVVSSSNLKEKLIGMSLTTPDVVSIFESLFGFQGSEFYFIDQFTDEIFKNSLEKLYGKKISTINKLLKQSIILGTYSAIQFKEKISMKNAFHLNPKKDYPLKKGFGLVVLSESFNSLKNDLINISKNNLIDVSTEITTIKLSKLNQIPRNISILSTNTNQESKIRKIIKNSYKFLNYDRKIQNWSIIGNPETVRKLAFDDLELHEHQYFSTGSIPIGLKLLPIQIHEDKVKGYNDNYDNKVYSYQVVEILNNQILKKNNSKIAEGDFIIHFDIPRKGNNNHEKLIYNKDQNAISIPWLEFINSDYRYNFIIDKDLTFRLLNFLRNLLESKTKTTFIYYQKSLDSDVIMEKFNLSSGDNDQIIQEYNKVLSSIHQDQKVALKNKFCYAEPINDYLSNLKTMSVTEKPYLLDQDHIILLNDEIDEGHYSNPVEDHDMIFAYNLFFSLFDNPNLIIDDIEQKERKKPPYVTDSQRERHKKNDLLLELEAELDNMITNNNTFSSEEAPSYISELNSYKTKSLLENNRRHNFGPFEGVDFLEVNSLTSKILASNFYDEKNNELINYLFDKKHHFFKYYVLNENLQNCTYSKLKNFFIDRDEIILGIIDYEFSNLFKGGQRKIKEFHVNPSSDAAFNLNQGDKIIVLSNYHNAFHKGDDYWDEYSFI